MRFLLKTFSCASIACLALAGCIVAPLSTSQKSPEVTGRVLDAQTSQPIPEARIALHEQPSTFTLTDTLGYFHLRETRNHHIATFLGPCSSDFPPGKYYGGLPEIS